ncbi:hypothetical protein ABI59_07560 [Acidobacteria bacterium Mor1]|nr:hypothetical protein ABI59_07560 [Acidobacteria bacterium Mor1]
MPGLTVWKNYYRTFKQFSDRTVRVGCEPRYKTRRGAKRSIVLVHGLSDSPHYMTDIGRFFHETLGYNVYLPLLHCHGLKKPRGMEEVELEEWKRQVRWAVAAAARATPRHVSVGGLSTGGALSFNVACQSPRITGDLYLFSAALDLVAMGSGLVGDMAERLLRSKRAKEFLDRRDRDKPLVGNNPVKYAYVDKDGAHQLVRLIKENDGIIGDFDSKQPFEKRVFAAHSHADETANIAGIKKLQRRSSRFTAYYIPKRKGVTHGGLVLQEDVIGLDGSVCTPRNVLFDDMMDQVRRFARGRR